MKLDELHVRNRRARAIRHRHAVAGRDVGVRRVEINLAAAARGQQRHRRGEGPDAAGFFVEHISAETAVRPGLTEFLARDQINREVIFKNLDVRLARRRIQQRPLDFPAGHVLRVQNAPLGMSAFLAQVQFPAAVFGRGVPLGKFHPQLNQFRDACRAFLDDGADDAFLAQARARRERVAHVQLERILLARHRRDAALRVIGVRLRPVLFRDDGHAPARRDLQREGQPRDAAAENEKVELFHFVQPSGLQGTSLLNVLCVSAPQRFKNSKAAHYQSTAFCQRIPPAPCACRALP